MSNFMRVLNLTGSPGGFPSAETIRSGYLETLNKIQSDLNSEKALAERVYSQGYEDSLDMFTPGGASKVKSRRIPTPGADIFKSVALVSSIDYYKKVRDERINAAVADAARRQEQATSDYKAEMKRLEEERHPPVATQSARSALQPSRIPVQTPPAIPAGMPTAGGSSPAPTASVRPDVITPSSRIPVETPAEEQQPYAPTPMEVQCGPMERWVEGRGCMNLFSMIQMEPSGGASTPTPGSGGAAPAPVVPPSSTASAGMPAGESVASPPVYAPPGMEGVRVANLRSGVLGQAASMARKERDEYLALIAEERKRLADMEAFAAKYGLDPLGKDKDLYNALADDAAGVAGTVDAIETRLRGEADSYAPLTPAETEFFNRWVDDIDSMWEIYEAHTEPKLKIFLVVGGAAAAAIAALALI